MKSKIRIWFGGIAVDLLIGRGDVALHLARVGRVFPAWVLEPVSGDVPLYQVEMDDPGDNGSIWLSQLIEQLAHTICKEGYGVFHGALMQRESQVLLVTGPSRSGKSTFSLGMRPWGFQPYADDLIFLRAEATRLHMIPMPRIIMARSPQYRGLRVDPVRPAMDPVVLFSQVKIVAPQVGKHLLTIPLERQRQRFEKLTTANLYTSAKPNRMHVAAQLHVRSELAKRCEMLMVEYESGDPAVFAAVNRWVVSEEDGVELLTPPRSNHGRRSSQRR